MPETPQILVTGATGMLGKHLIHLLHKEGARPRAFYRSTIPAGMEEMADWFKGDILDVYSLEEAMDGIKEVYHLAGLVSFSPGRKKELYRVNVEGTANVVNACIVADVKKLVHVSSMAAMGNRLKSKEPLNERMYWDKEHGHSEYGRSKYLGEMEVWRGIGEGLNAVMVNPVIIFGEHGDWATGSMAMFKNVYDGFKWYSEGSTGFVDADDVAAAMILLMNSDMSEKRFLLSEGNHSYKEVFWSIADAFGRPRPPRKVNRLLASVVWRATAIQSLITGADPLVTKESAATALAKIEVDNRAFLKAFPGFSYTPLDKSIQRIADSLKKTHRLK